MLDLVLTLVLLASGYATPPAQFQLVLERTASGWSAHCDSGCSWIDLSAKCVAACSATITNSGIAIGAVKADAARFSFVVERTATGWTANGLNGTAWAAVSWRCPPGSCKARIDGFGVYGIPAGESRSTGN